MFSFKDRVHVVRFPIVSKQGKRIFSNLTSVVFLKNDVKHRRFSFVVPKTVHKKAHNRNLLKRQIREIVRQNKESFPQNTDFIVFALKNATEANFEALKGDIQNLINRINS